MSSGLLIPYLRWTLSLTSGLFNPLAKMDIVSDFLFVFITLTVGGLTLIFNIKISLMIISKIVVPQSV